MPAASSQQQHRQQQQQQQRDGFDFGENKYSSVQGFDRARPRLRSEVYKSLCNVGGGGSGGGCSGGGKRPHSVDAEFLHQLERMGLSQSLPPFTTVSTKT